MSIPQPINNDIFDEETDDFIEETEFEHYRITVDPGQTPLRIDKFLNDRLPNVSRTKIQYAAEAGNIRVNEKEVKPNYKVKPGDSVSVVMSFPKRELEIIPEDIPLNIVYEDESLLVIDKEAGMVVHPSFGHFSGTMVNALAWYLKGNPMFSGDDFRPGLVHRIDKNTSGLLVVAKTETAKRNLALQFFNKTSGRKYTAVCWGNMKNDSGTVIGNIGRDPKDRKIMKCFPDGSSGKEAVTHYRVVERLLYTTIVECILETGRTHQIRAHFKHIKHPLFNDPEYGGDVVLKGTTFAKYKQFVTNCFALCPRQALHAKTLEFDHPITGERMCFDSPLPQDMQLLIEAWRNYTIRQRQD